MGYEHRNKDVPSCIDVNNLQTMVQDRSSSRWYLDVSSKVKSPIKLGTPQRVLSERIHPLQ